MTGIFSGLPEELCKNPKYNGRNLTNHVLQSVTSYQNKKKITYYCPAYVRIKIKNFRELSHENLQAAINSNILLTINFRGILPLVECKVRQLLRMSFNRDSSLVVQQQSNTVRPQKNGVISYVIPKQIHVAIKPDIFWSPFQILYLIMSIQLQDIQINNDLIQQIKQQGRLQIKKLKIANQEEADKGEKEYNKKLIEQIQNEIKWLENIKAFYIRFNMLDCQNRFVKMAFTAEGTFGNYDLAEQKLNVQYTNKSTSKRVRDQKIKKLKKKPNNTENPDYSIVKPYKYAHFQIPLYKYPMVTLTTIFVPLWLLGVITIGIYFQSTNLVDRVMSIAGLLIAFVELISVVRQQLPPSPKVSFLQILIYVEIIGTCILCLLESLIVKYNAREQDFVWQNSWQFIISCIVLIIEFIIIVVLIFIHKCYWQPSYNISLSNNEIKFNYEKWEMIECDKHFRRKIDNGIIKVAQVKQNIENMKNYLFSLQEKQKQQLEEKLELNYQDQLKQNNKQQQMIIEQDSQEILMNPLSNLLNQSKQSK